MAIQNINLTAGSGMPAVGSQLYLQNLQSPAVYNLVGNVGNQKWSPVAKTADTTNQGTVWMQSIPTILDGAKFTVELFFIPGSAGSEEAVGLEGHGFVSGLGWLFTQRQVRQWKLIWPDASVMFFSAYITDFPVDMAVEKALSVSMTLTVTGQPTFA
jgi:hypothetical protein